MTLECCRKFTLSLLTWSKNIICFLYTLNHEKRSGLRNLSQEISKIRTTSARIPTLAQKVSCLNITFHKNGFFLLAHKNILRIDAFWIKNNIKQLYKIIFIIYRNLSSEVHDSHLSRNHNKNFIL